MSEPAKTRSMWAVDLHKGDKVMLDDKVVTIKQEPQKEAIGYRIVTSKRTLHGVRSMYKVVEQ